MAGNHSVTPMPFQADALTVGAAAPLGGSAPLVGDKSISHRALLLAALADGPTRIRNLSPCADVGRTLACLTELGVVIDRVAPDEVTVQGRGPNGLGGPAVTLDCGDSGTTMRLLAGLLAGQQRAFTLDGAAGLRRRPMERVVAPLVAMGAHLQATDGHLPLRGRGGGLQGIEVNLAVASAQVGSAVLLAALNARGRTRVHYPTPVRDHTERMLAAMAAPVTWDGRTTTLDGLVGTLAPLGGGDATVPEDASAAAFLLAAAALVPGSLIRLTQVGMNPGRTGLLEVLSRMGASVRVTEPTERTGEPVANVELTAAPLQAVDVARDLVPRLIDELPLVAVLATQARGRTVVRDAGELRLKESDRIAAIVDGLSRLGADVVAAADGFAVTGPTPLAGTTVDGHDDHRIVMALAVAGLVASGQTVVTDAHRLGDSFPGFAGALAALGAPVEVR
jgi:3-phosphoshikimate 1-carboxyvinyltransferase